MRKFVSTILHGHSITIITCIVRFLALTRIPSHADDNFRQFIIIKLNKKCFTSTIHNH